MTMPARGTRWLRRVGKHANSEIEVTDTNEVSVFFVNHGGGNRMGNQKVDDSQQHTLSLEKFTALYVAKDSVVTGVHTGGRAFRQNNARTRQMEVDEGAEVLAPPSPPRNGHFNAHYISPGESGLSISVQLVTPDMAREWLDRGGANRRLAQRRVERLVAAIQIGEWQLTGDSIKLDADGRVRDGQHRLEAISRSGIPVQCLVVRNITEPAFDVIDTGRSRSPADVLAIHGHANTIAKAACARGLIFIERLGHYDVTGISTAAPTNAGVLAYVEAHPEVADGVRLADKLRGGDFIGGAGLWAVAMTLFWRISPEQAEIFTERLIEGAGLEAGSPILRLRNMYKGSARDWHASGENRERLLAIAIKAWNFWRRDELVQALTWHNSGRGAEKFPVPE